MDDTGHAPAGTGRLTYGKVLAISLPIIISNITTPLLGVTSTAVVGRLGEPHLIGAVALGSTVFSLLFWAFGFLRMGTTGLTAQADGAGDQPEVSAILARGLLLAGAAGLALVGLQVPLEWLSLRFLSASPAVIEETRHYFEIRIWSAPFALANYAFLGWFIGLGRTRTALALQVVLNGANVLLNLALVSWLGWRVAGIAVGTVAAEMLAAGLGAAIALTELRRRAAPIDWRRAIEASGVMRMLAVNSDLMVRTLCLLFAFTFFTAQAAKSGDVLLAANAVLLQLLNISSYLLDGFAFATEALTGRAIGAGRRAEFRRAVRLSSVWAGIVSLAMSAALFLSGGAIIDAMSATPEVREMARLYLPWAIAAPVAGVACFQLDGIFIGATRTRDMRNMMVLSLILFLLAWWVLTPAFGNHGLWASIIVFFIARAVTLGAYYPALEMASFRVRA